MNATYQADGAGSISEPRTDVGYKRPPIERRFQKGVSGNPNGRPRKSATIPADAELSALNALLSEANRRVSVGENGTKRKMKACQVIARRLVNSALAGDPVSARHVLKAVSNAQQRKADADTRNVTAIADYKRQWTLAIQDSRNRGDVEPDPVPHPYEIVIDSQTGKALFNGPRSETERAEWDRADRDRQEAHNQIEKYKRERDVPGRKTKARSINKLIQCETEKFAEIDRQYPCKEVRRQMGFDLVLHRAGSKAQTKTVTKRKKRSKGEPPGKNTL